MKLSWPKSLVKKWFNIKSKAEDFQADDIVYGGNWFIFFYLLKIKSEIVFLSFEVLGVFTF